MLLNLLDVQSIVSWWGVFPSRHERILEQLLLSRPQFRPTIRQAQREIASNEHLQMLLTKSLVEQDQHFVQMSERRAAMSSVEILRRDLAMVA